MGSSVQLKSKLPEHSSKPGEKRKREGAMCAALETGQVVSCVPALRASTDLSHTWKGRNTSAEMTGG